ncbi:MAG: hypothetical protein J0H23_15590 [Micrococcales bacterium]|nr:hypothetical protein [Micrococcales bacterium]OJX68724.1 MAG: hypothetical protein BGO94_08840 [Micrococcales bacterium 72-143]
MIRHRRTVAFLLAAVIPAAVVLSGCSLVDEVVYQQRSERFSTVTELTTDWAGSAPWVPDDADDIRIRESMNGNVVVMLVSSEAELDGGLCAEVERQSGPSYALEGAPDPYAATGAYACGDWTVIAADGGWYGWTPNDPEERTASPS